MLDKSEVQDRIRRAQRAILNPSTPVEDFLQGTLAEDTSPGEVAFSTNCISLEISGNTVADLSFCDLPGAYYQKVPIDKCDLIGSFRYDRLRR